MTPLDIGQVVFIAIVALIGVGGIIKVIFFDKD